MSLNYIKDLIDATKAFEAGHIKVAEQKLRSYYDEIYKMYGSLPFRDIGWRRARLLHMKIYQQQQRWGEMRVLLLGTVIAESKLLDLQLNKSGANYAEIDPKEVAHLARNPEMVVADLCKRKINALGEDEAPKQFPQWLKGLREFFVGLAVCSHRLGRTQEAEGWRAIIAKCDILERQTTTGQEAPVDQTVSASPN